MFVFNRSKQEAVALDVHMADGPVKKTLGVIQHRGVPPFDTDLPSDFGLVFPFRRVRRRGVHMLFVREPLDVIWMIGGTVSRVEGLDAWTGTASAQCDAMIEVPRGNAAGVDVEDELAVLSETDRLLVEKNLGRDV